MIKNFANTLLLCGLFFLCSCTIGPYGIAVEREKVTNFSYDGRIVSVTEKTKVNEPIAKASLATVAVAISKNPIAAAIVAGAQSIGDGIGNAVRRSGDTVNDVISGEKGVAITPLAIGKPQQIPVVDYDEKSNEYKKNLGGIK